MDSKTREDKKEQWMEIGEIILCKPEVKEIQRLTEGKLFITNYRVKYHFPNFNILDLLQ